MKSRFNIAGKFIVTIKRKNGEEEKFTVPNVVTVEGRNYLLRLGVSKDVSAVSWYMGLIGANVTPSENDTASSALGSGGSYGELTGYDETNRPTYNATFSTNKVSNSGSACSFTANTNLTVYGVFITSTSAKTSNTGVLLCAGRFSSAKSLSDDDILNVVYEISSV